ncbi:D-alanine--D-alanine ligase [Litoribrevibacter albus]|uniref:D-alanine--D-alanine ligase n=1 Tax=Litoribrevibacter albus TaxID=1473156 RepID=A0AA37SEZ5_9GAMM|nr:D-alanine--D-alanine ligase [Litoribrevibacter albus]GLQ33257.1 D-alanine--D-alanine ligase B [Litoribrevibacter albus]
MSSTTSFGKVAVLYGGTSAERDVSIKSGGAVCEALKSAGVEFDAIDAVDGWMERLIQGNYDRVFNAVHGRGGEDGKVQGFLELLGLPYTGSGVTASAIAMDKELTKHIWVGNGISTPEYQVVTDDVSASQIIEKLGLPLIVKPAHEGSSIGMSKANSESELVEAITKAKALDSSVLVEKWVTGSEFTIAILNGEALPVIRLETDHSFYDYDAKYLANDTRYLLPCGLDSAQESALQSMALTAFKAVGCEGWGRVDAMQDGETGKFYLLEVNTVPGMTDHSLVPMAAKARGMDFPALVLEVLSEASLKG